jgi:hypothetical protein
MATGWTTDCAIPVATTTRNSAFGVFLPLRGPPTSDGTGSTSVVRTQHRMSTVASPSPGTCQSVHGQSWAFAFGRCAPKSIIQAFRRASRKRTEHLEPSWPRSVLTNPNPTTSQSWTRAAPIRCRRSHLFARAQTIGGNERNLVRRLWTCRGRRRLDCLVRLLREVSLRMLPA